MEISTLTQELYNEYEKFLSKSKESLFYHSIKFKNFLKELLDCQENYLVCLQNSEIVGILPLLFKDGKYGRIYNSLPYYGSIGGIIAKDSEGFMSLVQVYNKIIEYNEVTSSTVITNPLYNQENIIFNHDLIEHRIGQFTKILFEKNPEEEILNKIDSSARRNIKKAINSGIIVEVDNQAIEFLKKVHKENMAEIGGKAKSDKFFELFPHYFSPWKEYNIYVAKKDKKLVSALLLFYYGKTVEYYIPATRKEEKTFQPMALILYQSITDAAKRGYTLWNWGGTWLNQTGVYRFKKKWGGEDKPYSYYVKLNNEKIKNLTKEEILKEYEGFYVVPFNYLNTGGYQNVQ